MTKKEVLDWLYRIKSKLTVYFPIKWVSECEQAINYAIKALENQKTGHWIDNKVQTKLCNCSECNALSKVYFKYCPNCGAKMEGVKQ